MGAIGWLNGTLRLLENLAPGPPRCGTLPVARRSKGCKHDESTIGLRTRLWHQTHVHPRGAFKGGHILRICPRCNRFFDVTAKSTQRFCGPRCGHMHLPFQGNMGYSKGGKRADLGGQYFRSRWEANYARFLNWLRDTTGEVVSWEFEAEIFEFTKIKKGVRFYTPDFKIQMANGTVEYHEVKGWRYPKGETALKRMAKYYPKIKIVVIDEEWFKAVNRQGLPAMIEGWEVGESPRRRREL